MLRRYLAGRKFLSRLPIRMLISLLCLCFLMGSREVFLLKPVLVMHTHPTALNMPF